jgi:hypothetical protein
VGNDYEVKESRTYMVEEGEIINGRRQRKKIANKKGLKRKKERREREKEGTNGITV